MRIKGLQSQTCFTQFPIQSLKVHLKKKSAFSVYILNVNLFKKRPITCNIFITYRDLMFLTILIMEKLF